jgi:hypothetical protein
MNFVYKSRLAILILLYGKNMTFVYRQHIPHFDFAVERT